MKATLRRLAWALLSPLGRPSARHRRQLEAALATPFPRRWSKLLETRCAHYRRLPAAFRDRFEQQTKIFLATKRITGVKTKVAEETRLLVAASAVSLTVGWPDYTWDQLAEVLLYPDDFDRDYNFGGTDASGQAHPWGIVILSVPTLNRSFDEVDDGYHVGFHEFAHLLDLAQTRFDGIPSYLSDDSIRRWMKIIKHEEDRLRRGDSVIDPYGLSGPAELFATAVEAFFQVPVALADRHRELYAFLSTYFGQDPASWSRPPKA
jgi:MtfA peptidase